MPKIAETAAHQVNGSIGHKELPSLKNFADTRWCGIYDMLSSFVPNKDVFALLRKSGVSGKLEKLPEFTEEDFSVMGDLISILEPISHAITSLESDQCRVTKAFPLLFRIKKHLENVVLKTNAGGCFRVKLIHALIIYYPKKPRFCWSRFSPLVTVLRYFRFRC